MPGLKTVKELRAEVERLTRLNARYRREAASAMRAAAQPCEVCVATRITRDAAKFDALIAERDKQNRWYRRCWNWITGR